MKTALVLGAGGFIGSHLVKRLKEQGCWVRGVDLKYPEYETTVADDFVIHDLRNPRNVESVVRLEAYNNHPLPYKFDIYPFSDKLQFDEVSITKQFGMKDSNNGLIKNAIENQYANFNIFSNDKVSIIPPHLEMNNYLIKKYLQL
jgi:hypothetical protein